MRSGERAPTERLLAALQWIPVDERVSRRAGELGRQYRRSHTGLSTTDLVIAATALELGGKLATGNTRTSRCSSGCGRRTTWVRNSARCEIRLTVAVVDAAAARASQHWLLIASYAFGFVILTWPLLHLVVGLVRSLITGQAFGE